MEGGGADNPAEAGTHSSAPNSQIILRDNVSKIQFTYHSVADGTQSSGDNVPLGHLQGTSSVPPIFWWLSLTWVQSAPTTSTGAFYRGLFTSCGLKGLSTLWHSCEQPDCCTSSSFCPGGPSLCPYTLGFSWLNLNVMLTLKLRPRLERNTQRETWLIGSDTWGGPPWLKSSRPLYNSWVGAHQNNFLPNSANTKPKAHKEHQVIIQRRQREREREQGEESAVEGGRWREQKKEFKMAKDAKSWDTVRSKHSATQPTLSSPCQMALKQRPMWCSQTENTTTVKLVYIRNFIAVTQKGGIWFILIRSSSGDATRQNGTFLCRLMTRTTTVTFILHQIKWRHSSTLCFTRWQGQVFLLSALRALHSHTQHCRSV